MIKFEVLQSPDLRVVGQYQFFHNEISLGSETGHLQIMDAKIAPQHLMIQLIDNELMIQPYASMNHYLLNGKRATLSKKAISRDKLTIGDTVIQIQEYHSTLFETKKDHLNKKLSAFISRRDERLEIIELLTLKMSDHDA
jgi:hypothetical protein